MKNGIRTNDIIIKINNEASNWNNLINSLRFATLGENLELNVLTSNNNILKLDLKLMTNKLTWKSNNICT